MIYPKGIVEFVKKQKQLKRFHKIFDRNSINVGNNLIESVDFELWMYEEGYLQSKEIKKYLFYLNLMSVTFDRIYVFFDKKNKNRENKKDAVAIATSREEMMFIARYLYYLESYGVKGDVLECGSYKGFSSCCLSHACAYLGKKLIIADSFQGLPESEEKFYDKGDYKGTFNEVNSNINIFGRRESVEYIKGWYKDSLKGFDKTICLLWIDVDLFQSTMDVLNNAFVKLSKNGVVFSHEFFQRELHGDKIKGKSSNGVCRAFKLFFEEKRIDYKAKFLYGNTALIVPRVKGKTKVLFSLKKDRLLNQYLKNVENQVRDRNLKISLDEDKLLINNLTRQIDERDDDMKKITSSKFYRIWQKYNQVKRIFSRSRTN